MKLLWFHRFIDNLGGIFFVTWFHGPKISCFLAKNHNMRGFKESFKEREQSFARQEAELSTEEDDQRHSQEKTHKAIR